jgi:hypothetical protein
MDARSSGRECVPRRHPPVDPAILGMQIALLVVNVAACGALAGRLLRAEGQEPRHLQRLNVAAGATADDLIHRTSESGSRVTPSFTSDAGWAPSLPFGAFTNPGDDEFYQ